MLEFFLTPGRLPILLFAIGIGIVAGRFSSKWIFPIGFFMVGTALAGLGLVSVSGGEGEAGLQPVIGVYLLWWLAVMWPSLGGVIGQFMRTVARQRRNAAPPAL